MEFEITLEAVQQKANVQREQRSTRRVFDWQEIDFRVEEKHLESGLLSELFIS